MKHLVWFALIASSLFTIGSCAAAHQTTPATVVAPGGWVAQQAPGYYRFRLGDFKITVVSDGTAPRDLTEILSNQKEVRRQLKASHQSMPAEISINCFLVDTGEHRILIDTGAGELFGTTSGHVVENLRLAGYRPEQIDVILLTHIHGDHSGGLSIGGKRVFPNATVYVDQRDPAQWLDRVLGPDASDSEKITVRQSHQTVDPYVQAGRLHTFDGAQDLYPGIRSVPEHGHTPGLTGYMIESRGKKLLVWGDIIHASVLQFRDPSITVAYDVDPKAAAITRARILSDAAEQGYLIGGAHLSFPGLGRVRAEEKGYSWIPEPYSVTLAEPALAE